MFNESVKENLEKSQFVSIYGEIFILRETQQTWLLSTA